MRSDYDMEMTDNYKKAYAERDLAYKDQARQIICKALGYEPPIQISVLSELSIRQCLKQLEGRRISQQRLSENIAVQVKFINKVMLERVTSYNC